MPHHTEQEGFPPIPMNPGMRFRVRAISPTTGAAVGGVTATEWAIYSRDFSEQPFTSTLDADWEVSGDEGDGA